MFFFLTFLEFFFRKDAKEKIRIAIVIQKLRVRQRKNYRPIPEDDNKLGSCATRDKCPRGAGEENLRTWQFIISGRWCLGMHRSLVVVHYVGFHYVSVSFRGDERGFFFFFFIFLFFFFILFVFWYREDLISADRIARYYVKVPLGRRRVTMGNYREKMAFFYYVEKRGIG